MNSIFKFQATKDAMVPESDIPGDFCVRLG